MIDSVAIDAVRRQLRDNLTREIARRCGSNPATARFTPHEVLELVEAALAAVGPGTAAVAPLTTTDPPPPQTRDRRGRWR